MQMTTTGLRRAFVALALMLSAWTNIQAQDNMTLNQKQQSLSTIAALEAKGDAARLYQAIDKGLDNGLSVAEIKEALGQLYAYTGFPRALNGLGQLQKVVADRQQAGKPTDAGQNDDKVVPDHFDALAEGTKVQTQLSGKPFNYQFAPRVDYYLKAHLFGDIFAGKVLDAATRELVTVSAIAALPGCEPQLRAHAQGALNMGLSRENLADIPEVLRRTVDEASARRASEAVDLALGKKHEATEAHPGIEDSPWPIGEFNAAYAQYFSGKSYLAPLGSGATNVTFEPGCRNNWHIHHHLVQVLVCVAGTGWYQEWGKEPVQLRPGMVIAIPEGVKHWHGAADDSWFQHVVYVTDVKEGASNEWLEPVER
jgi:4-carboxymuconolactone decarboxylase